MTLLKTNLLSLVTLTLLSASIAGAQMSDRTPQPIIEKKLNKTDGFSQSTAYTIPSKNTFSHRMALTLIVNKNGRWMTPEGQERIDQDIQKTIEIYSQCQISVSPITVIETQHEGLDINTCQDDYALTYLVPETLVPRPAVFYGGNFICDSKKSGEYNDTAYSTIAPQETEFIGLKENSVGTAFIAENRLDKLRNDLNYKKPGLLTVPHEISHITLDEHYHTQFTNNIMTDTMDARQGKLTPDQCTKILTSPFIIKNN